MAPCVYLAGPDVFMPDPATRAANLKAICERHGLIGISPLDPLPGEAVPGRPPGTMAGDAAAIARRNEAHIARSDAVLANLTPFRGPSADCGTVYEIGFARALGRPVFGYSCVAPDYATRVRALPASGSVRDANGLLIEDFGLFENLMVSCGIEESGGFTIADDVLDRWADLTVFERCAERAAGLLRCMPAGSGRQRARSA